MKELLSRLQIETFVLDLKEPLDKLPDNCELKIRKIDTSTIEVELDKTRSLNFLFEKLSKHNIRALSMRNKTNRLEELFVKLVKTDNDQNTQKSEVSA
jgi:ABC-2 type transport system ATP-binding protein